VVFASGSWRRIDDASPGHRLGRCLAGGKVVAYKPPLDEAIRLSSHQPDAV
jgi:propionyl-CoA synthetase